MGALIIRHHRGPSISLVSSHGRRFKSSINDTSVKKHWNICNRIEDLIVEAMPRYELALILKSMQRAETAAALRRTVGTLMERGAVVKDLENLGGRLLPYKIRKHNQGHSRGGYFSIGFYASPNIITGLMDQLHRDVDVVRPTVLKADEQVSKINCCGPQQ